MSRRFCPILLLLLASCASTPDPAPTGYEHWGSDDTGLRMVAACQSYLAATAAFRADATVARWCAIKLARREQFLAFCEWKRVRKWRGWAE